MTCCVIALALAYQLIAAWRGLKRLLGIAERTPRAPRAPGVAIANALAYLRHPTLRVALVAVLALEAGFAGAYVFEHRTHIGNEVAARVFDLTGFASALCDGTAASLAARD
ncbi:MAG: hypothetical protein AB7Q81_07850 [Gammaproteobacteria bacterium]